MFPGLPNDALILATCNIYDIKYLVSFDSDFREICDKEEIVLIDSVEKFKEVVEIETQEEEDIDYKTTGDETGQDDLAPDQS